MNDAAILALAVLAIAVALTGFVLLMSQRRRTLADTASDFDFSSPQDMDQQTFVYEVAGLIKVATGLETHVVALGKHEHLDIEVHRGMRCVGVVSVIPTRGAASVSDRVEAMAHLKSEKRVKVAYVVSGSLFDEGVRRRAKRAGVTLLDGKALKRIRYKAELGGYARKSSKPAEPNAVEAQRWQRPKATEIPIHPVPTVAPSLDVTQKRRIPLPPWVEFR